MSTLNEQYSLAWLESSTIIIFTFIGSLFYILSNISGFISNSRSRIETVCDSINTTSEQIFNAPYILYRSTLTAIITAKENIYRNLSTALLVLEKCIVWLITMYKSTYRCLLGVAVHIVLSIVTSIAGPLQQAAQSITSFVTGGRYQVGDWTASLTSVQTKIDNWVSNDGDVIQQIVDKPFQLLQQQLNDTLNAWQPVRLDNGNSSLFQQYLQQGDQQPQCDPTNLLNSLNTVEYELSKWIKVLIGLLFVMFFLCVLINIFMIRFRYHRIAQMRSTILRLFRVSESTSMNDQHQQQQQMHHEVLLDKYVATTISKSTVFSSLWQRLHRNNKKRQHGPIYKLAQFMCHPVAIYCFIVGFGGLIITYSLIWVLETKSRELIHDFTAQTQQWTQNATAEWTNAANQQFQVLNDWINQTEYDLNDHAFGIIKSTALTINTTLTSVVSQVQGLIHDILGGTILETPAQDLTQCLLLAKIENIEQGLTWIVSLSLSSFLFVNSGI